jgi:hypothetical protein
MSWKWVILNDYALHLYNKHRNDENFDTSLEHKIMNDWLTYEKFRDNVVFTVSCDHIDCNWHKKYHVAYEVTEWSEEE